MCGTPEPAAHFPGRPRDGSPWRSPDPKLARLGIKFLQLGGDTWNRCGRGWLNADANFDAGDGAPVRNRIFTDGTGRHILSHVVERASALPVANHSLQLIYSEHMIEHMTPLSGGGVNMLREAWRALAPGGVIRLVTPDLAKYVCDLADGGRRGFLVEHARAFPPMEPLETARGRPPSLAGVVNNIFRNYGHEWIYDFGELRLAAARAGIDPAHLCRSDRSGLGLPRWAVAALRRANEPRNRTHTCWLDQKVREAESLYAVIRKPATRVPLDESS